MINEVIVEDGEMKIISWTAVAVKEYGEGCMPIDAKQCPYFQEEGSETSCVSLSGDSICGGFNGYYSGNVVRCAYGRKW